MARKTFKPFLAPNKMLDIKDLPYPLLASYKIDGIRGLITKEKILCRSLKLVPSKQVQEKFTKLKNIPENIYTDGEFYNPNITFQMILSCVMTQDYYTNINIKKWKELCEKYDINISREEALNGIKLYLFDRVNINFPDEPFEDRNKYVKSIISAYPELLEYVNQVLVTSPEEAEAYYNKALAWGCDGLILRTSRGRYKYGRGTLKEGLIFKLKPYETFDAKIIGVIQATKVDPNAEKKTNELGRSVTSKKKGDRILIEKACDFEVMHKGHYLKVVIKKNDIEKREIWKNRKDYIGKYIEYKGLMVGAKDVPRHAVSVRFRFDK